MSSSGKGGSTAMAIAAGYARRDAGSRRYVVVLGELKVRFRLFHAGVYLVAASYCAAVAPFASPARLYFNICIGVIRHKCTPRYQL
jgi:hypothetical protein